MHGAGAYADFTGDFEDAVTGPQMLPDALFKLLADARPTERAVDAKLITASKSIARCTP